MNFEDRLLVALHERVADEPPPGSRSPVAVASLAVVAVALIALVASLSSPTPAVAVERDDEWITVRLLDVDADPAKVERELRAAGVDATVVVEPAPDELVGRWTRAAFAVGGPVGEVDDDEIRIPADVTGPVEVGLGREPRPGESTVMLAPRPQSEGCGSVRMRMPNDDATQRDAAPAAGAEPCEPAPDEP